MISVIRKEIDHVVMSIKIFLAGKVSVIKFSLLHWLRMYSKIEQALDLHLKLRFPSSATGLAPCYVIKAKCAACLVEAHLNTAQRKSVFLGCHFTQRFWLRENHTVPSTISNFVPDVLTVVKDIIEHVHLPPPSEIDWKQKAEEFWVN
ncbi:hypothetical protein J6590_076071 [Homalodisca vitripennis]|nr:hypothetical protein J6590_076071 [Homalodisca vitripennis]